MRSPKFAYSGLQFGGASWEDRTMNAYSKDLRLKVLAAVDRVWV